MRYAHIISLLIVLAIMALFLLCSQGFAQSDTLKVRDFSFGLMTNVGDFHVPLGAASRAVNVDFGASPKAMTIRKGYDSISTIAGQDSILAIFPMNDADGEKRLIVVTDSAGVGYGNVYITRDGSARLDSAIRISTYWGVQSLPSGAQYNDAFYMVNGRHKGIVWDGKRTRQFPMRAPGEPTIVPIDGVDSLNGEYRYFIGYKSDTSGNIFTAFFADGDTLFQGVVSQPVRVSSGKVLMTNFPWPATDSVRQSFPAGVRYMVMRTLANPGRLDPTDSFFYVASFLIPNADSADKYVFVDSIGDASALATGFFDYIGSAFNPYDNGLNVQGGYFGSDSSLDTNAYGFGGKIYARLGAPGFSGTIHAAYDTTSAKTSKGGIFYGIPKQTDTLGVAYAITYIDTITGMESDTGRSICIFNNADSALARAHTLNFPALQDSGLVRNLYRGLIAQITYDTGYWFNERSRQAAENSGGPDYYIVKLGDKWVERLAVDTVVITDYFLVAQIGYADTSYTDSIRQDSLEVKRRYSRRTTPSLLDNLVAYNNTLIGNQGNRLLWSNPDSVYNWGAFDFNDVNRDDGDKITVIYPSRSALRVLKNNSGYNVYDNSLGQWVGKEITQRYGAIAPKSYAAGIGGNYYLSRYGAVLENEGQQLERTVVGGLISDQLDNFRKLSVTTLRDCRGFYHDQKVMFSFPSLDSTYIYDERTGSWSVWDFAFASAAHYGTEVSNDLIPGDTMYFIKGGESKLYRFGTSTTDKGAVIKFLWSSASLVPSLWMKDLSQVALWVQSTSTTDSSLLIGPLMDTATYVQKYAYFSSLKSDRVFLHDYAPGPPGTAFQLVIANFYGFTNTTIDGLDIVYRLVETKRPR